MCRLSKRVAHFSPSVLERKNATGVLAFGRLSTLRQKQLLNCKRECCIGGLDLHCSNKSSSFAILETFRYILLRFYI